MILSTTSFADGEQLLVILEGRNFHLSPLCEGDLLRLVNDAPFGDRRAAQLTRAYQEHVAKLQAAESDEQLHTEL